MVVRGGHTVARVEPAWALDASITKIGAEPVGQRGPLLSMSIGSRTRGRSDRGLRGAGDAAAGWVSESAIVCLMYHAQSLSTTQSRPARAAETIATPCKNAYRWSPRPMPTKYRLGRCAGPGTQE